MARFVLDAYALMAFLQNEPGAVRVRELLEQAETGEHEIYLTVVNMGEVLYNLERRRGIAAVRTMLAIDQRPVQLVGIDRPLAFQAAGLKATTGLGYADCFVAACAQELEAAVVTGDSDFRRVEDLVPVEWLF